MKKLFSVLVFLSFAAASNVASAASTCDQPLCIVNNTTSDYTLVQYAPPSVPASCNVTIYTTPANVGQGYVLHPGDTIQYAYAVSGANCTAIKSSFSFASATPTSEGNWPSVSFSWSIVYGQGASDVFAWWETVDPVDGYFIPATAYYNKPVSQWNGTYVNGKDGYIVVNIGNPS